MELQNVLKTKPCQHLLHPLIARILFPRAFVLEGHVTVKMRVPKTVFCLNKSIVVFFRFFFFFVCATRSFAYKDYECGTIFCCMLLGNKILHHRNTTSSMKAGHLFSLFSTVQLKEKLQAIIFFLFFVPHQDRWKLKLSFRFSRLLCNNGRTSCPCTSPLLSHKSNVWTPVGLITPYSSQCVLKHANIKFKLMIQHAVNGC